MAEKLTKGSDVQLNSSTSGEVIEVVGGRDQDEDDSQQRGDEDVPTSLSPPYTPSEEDAQLIASLEASVASPPDLNLLTSFTDSNIDDDDDSSPLDASSMYNSFFEDAVYASSFTNLSTSPPTIPGPQSQSSTITTHHQQHVATGGGGSILERQLTNPSTYRWCTSMGYSGLESFSDAYMEDLASDVTTSNTTTAASSCTSGASHCHRLATSSYSDYPAYGNTATLVLEEPASHHRPSPLTATVSYAEVPECGGSLQALYGVPRMISRSCLHPVVGQPQFRMGPPTTATIIQKGNYSARNSANSYLTDPKADLLEFEKPVCQQRPVITAVATDSFKNTTEDNDRQHPGFCTDNYYSSSPMAVPSRGHCQPPRHLWPESHSWTSSYRTGALEHPCSKTFSLDDREQQFDGGYQTLCYSYPKEYAVGHNFDPLPSAGMCESTGRQDPVDNVKFGKDGSSLLDLSKPGEATQTSSSQDGGTSHGADQSKAEAQSTGILAPASFVQLPSFATQFGLGSHFLETRKRKGNTVRELLQEKSKQKLLALLQPTMSSRDCVPVPLAAMSSFPPSTSFQYTNQQSRGDHEVSSLLRCQLQQRPVEVVSDQSKAKVHNIPVVRKSTTAATTTTTTPAHSQVVPVILLQNVPQTVANHYHHQQQQQLLQLLLPGSSPIVRPPSNATVTNTGRTVIMKHAATSTSLTPQRAQATPKTSLLRQALGSDLPIATTKKTQSSQIQRAASPSLNSPCIMSLLSSGKYNVSPTPPPPPPSKTTIDTKATTTMTTFRPQHYDMEVFQVGSFRVTRPTSSVKNMNKFKVLFAKRKFVYEFQVLGVIIPGHSGSVTHVAAIDVPFNTVNAIHCNKHEILVSVIQPPSLSVSCKYSKSSTAECSAHYDRARQADVTEGQLRTSHIHKIYLKRPQAETLSALLEKFDPRFTTMMHTAIVEVVEKNNLRPSRNGQPHGKRQCVVDVSQSPRVSSAAVTKESAVPCVLCHCQVSCRSNRCSCMKARLKCGQGASGCFCRECDNPLNLLELMGFRTEECAADICLVHNIVSYKGDLKAYLEKEVKFPCCDTQVKLKECIPGRVHCPNKACGRTFKYSWCEDELQDEVTEPRNHCSSCRSCRGCVDLHCTVCRRCNPVKARDSHCPDCSGPLDTSFTEIRDIANVLLLLAHQDTKDSPSVEDNNEVQEVDLVEKQLGTGTGKGLDSKVIHDFVTDQEVDSVSSSTSLQLVDDDDD